MKDRIPTPGQEGRVQIEYEDGTKVFATISMADNPTELGTPLATATLLKDATAALYGKDRDAVPDDVLAWVGKHNLHWWSVLYGKAHSYYAEQKTVLTSGVDLIGQNLSVEYAQSISIDQDTGAITLVNPQTLSTSYGTNDVKTFCQTLVNAAPVYVSNGSGVFYIPEGATYTSTSWAEEPYTLAGYYNSGTKVKYIRLSSAAPVGLIASRVTSQIVNVAAGDVTYVQSYYRNAYPDNETVDELTYRYLGVPFQNAVNAGEVVIGSYTGTGTAGPDNPNVLTFSKIPKFVLIMPETEASFNPKQTNGATWFFMIHGVTKIGVHRASDNTSNEPVYITWDGETVSWYHYTSLSGSYANAQMNAAGTVYHYMALL